MRREFLAQQQYLILVKPVDGTLTALVFLLLAPAIFFHMSEMPSPHFLPLSSKICHDHKNVVTFLYTCCILQTMPPGHWNNADASEGMRI